MNMIHFRITAVLLILAFLLKVDVKGDRQTRCFHALFFAFGRQGVDGTPVKKAP